MTMKSRCRNQTFMGHLPYIFFDASAQMLKPLITESPWFYFCPFHLKLDLFSFFIHGSLLLLLPSTSLVLKPRCHWPSFHQVQGHSFPRSRNEAQKSAMTCSKPHDQIHTKSGLRCRPPDPEDSIFASPRISKSMFQWNTSFLGC